MKNDNKDLVMIGKRVMMAGAGAAIFASVVSSCGDNPGGSAGLDSSKRSSIVGDVKAFNKLLAGLGRADEGSAADFTSDNTALSAGSGAEAFEAFEKRLVRIRAKYKSCSACGGDIGAFYKGLEPAGLVAFTGAAFTLEEWGMVFSVWGVGKLHNEFVDKLSEHDAAGAEKLLTDIQKSKGKALELEISSDKCKSIKLGKEVEYKGFKDYTGKLDAALKACKDLNLDNRLQGKSGSGSGSGGSSDPSSDAPSSK